MHNPIRDAILRYAESRVPYSDHFPDQPADLEPDRWDEFWQDLIQSLEYDAQCRRRPSVRRYLTQRLVINPLHPKFEYWREGAILWLSILTTLPEFHTSRYEDSPPHEYALILGGRFGRWLKLEFDHLTPESSGERDYDGREIAFHVFAGGTHLGLSEGDHRRFASNGVQLVCLHWVQRPPSDPLYRKDDTHVHVWRKVRSWRRKERCMR